VLCLVNGLVEELVLSVGRVRRMFNMKMDTRIVLVVKQDLEKI